MVKALVHPVTGLTVRLGRKRPDPRARKLRLRDYLTPALPAPPAAIDYSPKAAAGLGMILANDRLGDCTAAGAGHLVDVVRGNADSGLSAVTEADAIAFYSATTGYNPNDPSTDQGGDERTVLDWWRDKGFFADGSGKIAAWVAVDATNAREVRTALWLAEGLYFGVELPDAWLDPIPSGSGFVWDVAGDPDPANGHCFVGVGYADEGVKIATWGMLGALTWAALAKYAATPAQGELYAVFSADAIDRATGKAPNGLALAQLLADSTAL